MGFSSSFNDFLRRYQKPMVRKNFGANVKKIALLSKTNASTHASMCNIARTIVRVRFKCSEQASQMNQPILLF